MNVVQISPSMPPNLTTQQQNQWKVATAHTNPWRLYVDKQNSSLLRIAGSGNGGTFEVTLENQLFNSSIPASAFTYTPPAGAKEITAPPTSSLAGPNGARGLAPGGTPMPPPPAHK